MKTWYVTVCIEETIEVQAETEEQAMFKACDMFDPTAHDKEVVECYTEDEHD